ncbi:replication protein A 70 kDa DNA-binding subunit C-like [Hordeum vulgare]|uniref:Replication protein A subunit n=1 Tax=Hordeum vulgare subsp. vulgare TaxID=112509 RepID=A0A8I6WRI1_HORVV|nr:replication protein A 70 kDa DNA-binding subunit C-like [Hordeum vulgare]
MGGGAMEVDLTHGAVAAMSRLQRGLRPVLQVVGAPARRGATDRYRFLLSDGVHSQEGILVPSLDSLVRTGRLRDGTVIRVLDYVCNRRVIIVIQLEVVQTECTLIGSPSSYQVNAAEPNTRSCSGSLGIHGSRAEHGVNEMAFSPDQGLLRSSIAAREENAVNNLPFSGLHGSVLKQDTINAKMQQLSLNSHQGKMPAVCPTCQGFDPHPTEFSCQQPPPVYVNRGSVANNGTPVTPFAFLNPYQGRWTIKGRVTAKTNHLHGKALSFDLLDARGGEIRATCFGSMVAQFSDQLVVGNVYFISGGLLKRVQKLVSCLNSAYELILDSSTSIEICCSDDSGIPWQQYNFQQISEILVNMDKGAMVDLLGIVTSVSPSVIITRKGGVETQKRTLQLKVMSGCSVEITLWGNVCNAEGQLLHSMCISGSNPILALKGGRICEFNGKSVGTISSTLLKINPDLPDAEKLMQWYINEGKLAVCTSLSQETSSMGKMYFRKTVAQIKDENLGRSDQPDWVTVEATISHISTEKISYPACTTEVNGKRCNKKVTNNGDGMWHCHKCQQSSQNCEYRYLFQCKIQDHTGTTNATAFQEAGQEIIGLSAEELFMIKNVDLDDARFGGIIHGACYQQYLLKLKVLEETFSGEARVKISIVKAERLDHTSNKSRVFDLGSSAPVVNGVATATTAGFTISEAGQQAKVSGRMPNAPSAARYVQACSCGSTGHNVQNCPAAMDIQLPATGWDFTPYDSSASKAHLGTGPKTVQVRLVHMSLLHLKLARAANAISLGTGPETVQVRLIHMSLLHLKLARAANAISMGTGQ